MEADILAGLLVSVRSASEARAALEGGAAVIDVKEPDRGPLGAADYRVWREVRDVVPAEVPMSVALGELREWGNGHGQRRYPTTEQFAGLTYRKLGLSGAGPRWEREWGEMRRDWGPRPAWIAVVYADWTIADAPHPDAVQAAAIAADDCAGILIDTWDKSLPSPLVDLVRWGSWIARARRARPLVIALAGGLDAASILRLAPLGPDLFAVRGAACERGDRRAAVDRERVAGLVRAIATPRSASP